MSRTDLLLAGAKSSGFTVDFLYDLTAGLSRQALLRVISNASSIPSYKKSSDSPYVFRSARAPSKPNL